MAEKQIEITKDGATAKVHAISLKHWLDKGWSVLEKEVHKLEGDDEGNVEVPDAGEEIPAVVSDPGADSVLTPLSAGKSGAHSSEQNSDESAQGELTQS